jgi:hypothetical protein
MNEARLRALLHEAPVPGAEAAERRGQEMVAAAFAERRREARSPLPRLALALAVAALVGALLLSPAGASVRDWVGDVFTSRTLRPERGLAEIPGGGRLLVAAADGPWVVQPDGSRRLLGDYGEATWSPRGLYVAVASGRTLSALVAERRRAGQRPALVALGLPDRLPQRPRAAGHRRRRDRRPPDRSRDRRRRPRLVAARALRARLCRRLRRAAAG